MWLSGWVNFKEGAVFLKIKNHLINLAHISDIIITPDKKLIGFFEPGENGNYVNFSVDPEKGKNQITQAEYDVLIDFLSIGEYEGCLGAIDILEPLTAVKDK